MSKLIYVADDEKNIRELIKHFLMNAGFEVLCFENGDLLQEQFKEKPADMVILDVTMPGIDGISLCSNIREISNVPIVIVSARDSEVDRIMGFTAGSDDYMVKPFSPTELVVRVQAIFRRMSLSPESENPSVLTLGALSVDEKKRKLFYGGKDFDVSPTEYEFLRYMVKHKDRAVSREELLKHVWQYDYEIDTRATDDVVKRLRKKLSSTNVLIEAVWGFGFILKIEEES